jgi:hypothetical protein
VQQLLDPSDSHRAFDNETRNFTPGQTVDDPFAMLKKKEKINKLLGKTIEEFLLMDKESVKIERTKALDMTQAKRLTSKAITTM